MIILCPIGVFEVTRSLFHTIVIQIKTYLEMLKKFRRKIIGCPLHGTDILRGKIPNVAIYQAIIEHIDRSSGGYPYCLWDTNGPKYVLNDNNEIEYSGKFIKQKVFQRTFTQLTKSHLVQKTLQVFYKRNRNEMDLFVAVIEKSRNLLSKNNGTRFIVVLWNSEDYEEDFDYVFRC